MLARVPPPRNSSVSKQLEEAADKCAVIENASHRRHSLGAFTSSLTRSTLDSPTGKPFTETPGRCDSLELPILRTKYVARDVRVLSGSRWRLHRFQERSIVLRTGAAPTLAMYDVTATVDSKSLEEMQPETTYSLPLDATCELTGISGRHQTATGIQISAAGDGAFRLRVRFATAADAVIWCSLLRDTLAHARWSRDVKPLKPKQQAHGRNVRVVQHTRSFKRFVVKVLESNRTAQMDCHELQILRRLHGCASAREAGLVQGYRVVETPQEVLLVMPQLRGITLLQLLRQRRLTSDEAHQLVSQLAKLLRAVHEAGVVHCDLNLENVLVASDISRVWLVDFGGAFNLLDRTAFQEQRMTGTPGFIAPERVQDPLTPPTLKADVFSLGVLLFQTLAGQHPYLEAANEQRSLRLSDSLALDWTGAEELLVAQHVQPELRGLVGKMLVADPRARISLNDIFED